MPTAQIIQFPSRSVPAPPTRSRGLVLSIKAADVLARLNRGEVITDLGQIDRDTRRTLDKLTKRGWLSKGVDYTFPRHKTCWCAKGLTHEDIGDQRVTFVADYIAEIKTGDRRRFPPMVERAS